MRVSDLVVEVRDSSLARVGQLLPKDLEGFTAVLRFNATGTWTLNLPTDHVLVDALRAPGAGIVVTGPSFGFSGPTNEAKRSQSTEDPKGSWTVSGLTDDVIFGERLAYPTPASANVAAQTLEYDVRTGKASTVIYGFVNANVGPSAPAGRKVASVSLAADGALGSTITASARFEPLGKLLTRLAAIDGLGFQLKQSGANLVFSVYQPTDRSAYVRMDIDNNLLTKSEYTYAAPGATRAIVGGQGDGTARTFVEVTTTASTTAETAWNRRIEVFKDQRSDTLTAALTQAGTEELADKGKTLEAVSVSPSDDVTMAFGTDWFLGDKVSVIVGSTSIVQIVTEVGFKISEDGVRIGATVGSPSVADVDSTVVDTQDDQGDRISNLERNTASGDNSVTTDSIVDTSVTTAKIADGSITSAKIADGTIVNADVSASAAIATSKISGLDTALAAKAPIASPTFTGTATSPTLRLTSTTDLTLTSTGHAFQVGPDNGANVAIDQNEISGRNNGAAATLFLNTSGGNVTLGSAASAISVPGSATITGTLVADDGYVTANVLTAVTGWSISTAYFRKRNGVAMINLGLVRTGAAITAGNITNVTAATLNVGFRPASEALAGGGPSGPVLGAYINTSGAVVITAIATGIATSDAIDINATFILA